MGENDPTKVGTVSIRGEDMAADGGFVEALNLGGNVAESDVQVVPEKYEGEWYFDLEIQSGDLNVSIDLKDRESALEFADLIERAVLETTQPKP